MALEVSNLRSFGAKCHRPGLRVVELGDRDVEMHLLLLTRFGPVGGTWSSICIIVTARAPSDRAMMPPSGLSETLRMPSSAP